MVYDDDGKLLGQTPFFFNMSPRHRQYYIFRSPDKFENWEKRLEYKCPIDWGQSIIPNATPALLGMGGLFISGASLAIDAISGHLFFCKEGINLEQVAIKNVPLKKMSVLVLPVFDKDVKKSNRIREHWLKNIIQDKEIADRVVDLNQSEGIMHFRGITNVSVPSFEDIDRSNLSRVAAELNTTHGVYFKKRESEKGKSLYKAELYDLFTGKKIVRDLGGEFEYKNEREVSKTYVDTILGLINLVPNSLTLTYLADPRVYYNSSHYGLRNNGSHSTEEHPEAIPQLLTIFGVANILHPQFYKSWDFDVTTFPMFKINTWQSDVEAYSAQVIAFMATYNAGFTTHTPFGAISLEAGYGFANLNMQDTLGMDENKFKWTGRYNINYVAFFNKRWYFVAAFTQYQVHESVGRKDYYELDKWNQSSFGFGYYFPSFKSIIRDWFVF